MGLTVVVTDDYDAMSLKAADMLIPHMYKKTGEYFRLGTATGSSPTGLYNHIAERQGEFNPRRVITCGLDEYVGLPGNTADERSEHHSSYEAEMNRKLFSRTERPFLKTYMPPGSKIDAEKIDGCLENGEAILEGTGNGKAVIAKKDLRKPSYMTEVEEQKSNYLELIGGGEVRIDCWVVGVGENGHIAMHEKGIPLHYRMVLVRLDQNTRENAYKDGYFPNLDEVPIYALSMGAGGVVELSKTILLLASGDRKTEPLAKGLLDPETEDVPISVVQRYIKKPTGNDTICVFDEVAAQEILETKNLKRLAAKGIELEDMRS
ncbi:MAG: 6-phosphogluconolactonase [Candidatus Aenigmatarchaeota archaeon]|nr:MAG: 6-phosphogluconolactonase [Candidatus Aenigmarchaeota archaeon]